MKLRYFNFEKDFDKIYQIWQEVGWIKDDEKQNEALQYFVKGGQGKVALLKDQVEGYVNSTPGHIQYLDEELSLQAVSAVTISRIARKQGIATKATAEVIAESAAQGVNVSALGMFEQGFYNKLGYGTGSYEHLISFDPDHLNLIGSAPIPERITLEDFKDVHKSRLERTKKHGYCTLLPTEITRAEILFGSSKSFGLGFRDKADNITHHMWIKSENDLHGPYFIRWMVFNNKEQFFELMNLLRNLGDQVHLIKLWEPAGIQFQNFIEKPYRDSHVTKNSKFEVTNKAIAYWQARILNLKDCINKTTFPNNKLEFNIKLKDPIEKYLDANSPWQGLSGEYTISFGRTSGITNGLSPGLPILKTDINTFTRMWLGIVRPSLLPYTNYFKAPEKLIQKLDNLFITIPKPNIDWDF
ncbi:MAG: GNAT family N-acetyltransferase [Halanaerobiales bacterium]